jgi:ankyrin repeat protein
LAKYGGDVNYIDGERTLLETAVLCDKSYVYDLLKAGANPNITGVHNEILPISIAIMNGNLNMVKLLCRYSVDVNLLHSFGDSLVTPIHMAIIYANSNQEKKEYMECLKEIVKKGNLCVKDSYGDTPLEAASSRENKEAVTIIQRELLARKFKK